MKKVILIAFCASFSLVACSSKKMGQAQFESASISIADKESAPRQLAIATAEPEASRIGKEVFAAGGNIVDAAVAASIAVSTVRQQSTGLGGGGFLLYHSREKELSEVWDFRETAPIASTEDMFMRNERSVKKASLNGAMAVGTPGLLKGLYELHEKYGELPWRTLVEPSIRLARKGVAVSPHLAYALKFREDVLRKDAEIMRVFFRNGEPMEEGDLLVQEDLAKTLESIAIEGARYFYWGGFANALDEYMRKAGGYLRKKDLINYEVKRRFPLRQKWGSYEILTMPPPSSGGIVLLQLLGMTDHLAASFQDSFQGKVRNGMSIGSIVGDVESMKRAFADRTTSMGDPDFFKTPVKKMLNAEYLRRRANEIEDKGILRGKFIRPFDQIKGNQTSHLSLMDNMGNVISTTQTNNFYMGAGVMVPGTGVILNNEMDDFTTVIGSANSAGLVTGKANAIRPRKRPLSSMTPTIVLGDAGTPVMALGAAGGPKIITSVYYVLSRVLKGGQTPYAALQSCRYHHQWKPDVVMVEEPCAEDFDGLDDFYEMVLVPEFQWSELQMVGRSPDGFLYAATDPRGHSRGVIWPSSTRGRK